MNPILHKTLALALSASLLSAYGSPTFAWEHTLVSDEQHYADAAGYNGVSYDGGNGGAFEITKTGNATFENTTLNNNTITKSSRNGGAIYSKGHFAIGDNVTLNGNTATRYGGAIYSEGSGTFGDGVSLSGNKAEMAAGAYLKNNSHTFGKNLSVTDNKATGSAAGIGAYYTNLTIGDNATFANNEATRRGGAINLTGYKPQFWAANIGNNARFIANKSAEKGGAMNTYLYDVTIGDNATFDKNEAMNAKGTGLGGAIYNTSRSLVIGKGATFSNNKAAQGGAIYQGNDSDLLLTSATFTGNQATGNATQSAGGAIMIDKEDTHDVTINDSAFTENKADVAGGAILQMDGSKATITLNNTTFTNNQTGAEGGAVVSDSTLLVNNSTFTGNKTTSTKTGASETADDTDDGGGAIMMYDESNATITGSVFQKNESGTFGGAISTRSGASSDKSSLKVENSVFEGNKAANRGGAINATVGATIQNSQFTANESANGGAIYNHAAVITVKDSTFTGNKAGTNGGAIFNANKAVLNLEGNNTFADNTANGVANDIYNDGILNINSGTTTLAGGIAGAGALQVKGSAALNLGQSTAQADSITLDNGASLAVEFANNAMGNLKANTITIGENAEDTAKLTVTLSRDFLTDTTAVSHELTNGTAVTNGSFALADVSNALYQVTMDNNVVTAVRKAQEETQQEIVNAGGNANDMNVLNAFTTSADMGSAAANQTADLINTLAQTDVAGAVQATEAVAPEVASAKQVVHGSITREVFNTLQTRMDNVSGNAPQAFALADEQSVSTQGESAVWLQGLLNKSHKEATDTDAFTGRSTGLAFGLDKQLSDALLLGAGYAYTHTNVSSASRHDRILGDNFFVYGQYRPSRFFVQGSLGYGDSKYEESKYLPGLTVKGDYHVKNYSAQAVAGYEWTEALIPTVGVRYISLQQEGYKDSSDQAISAEQNNYLSGLAGITLKGAYQATANLRLMPQLRAGLSYDFVSDQAQGTVVLPNGSNYAVSGERLHRLGFETGVSVGAYVFENVEALLGYEGNFRQDYASHTGTLKFRYLF